MGRHLPWKTAPKKWQVPLVSIRKLSCKCNLRKYFLCSLVWFCTWISHIQYSTYSLWCICASVPVVVFFWGGLIERWPCDVLICDETECVCACYTGKAAQTRLLLLNLEEQQSLALSALWVKPTLAAFTGLLKCSVARPWPVAV